MKYSTMWLSALALAMIFTACEYNSGDTYNGDIDNSIKLESGTLFQCNDSNCSETTTGEYDGIVCVYDANYTEIECQTAGFIWLDGNCTELTNVVCK